MIEEECLAYRIGCTEQLAGNVFRNHRFSSAGIEVGFIKRLACKKIETKHPPERIIALHDITAHSFSARTARQHGLPPVGNRYLLRNCHLLKAGFSRFIRYRAVALCIHIVFLLQSGILEQQCPFPINFGSKRCHRSSESNHDYHDHSNSHRSTKDRNGRNQLVLPEQVKGLFKVNLQHYRQSLYCKYMCYIFYAFTVQLPTPSNSKSTFFSFSVPSAEKLPTPSNSTLVSSEDVM